MKNRIFLPFISLLGVISIASCSSVDAISGHAKELRNPDGLSHQYDYETVNSNEYCAFKEKLKSLAARLSESFAKREYEEGTNITCSPLSIELCLGLAVRSCNGVTRQELLNLFDVDYETFNMFYKTYFNELTVEVKDTEDKIALQILLTNSIWFDNDISLFDSGLDALRDDYYCYSYEVDFGGANASANKAIQDFINDKTKGLINPKLDLPSNTLFVLMNTLYLKDIWNDYGYDLSYASSEHQFTNSNGNKSDKRLLEGYYYDGRVMNQEDYSAFYTSAKFGVDLYFVKPNENKRINDIFTSDVINHVSNKSNYIYRDDEKREEYHTKSVFPEFKADCNLDLIDMFKEDFNVNTLFTSQCDFSNLTNQTVYCEEIKHIAKLKVDKTGIEGAAVTFMVEAGAAAPEYEQVYETFEVDKEFGFILTYKNSILFSGIVTNID